MKEMMKYEDMTTDKKLLDKANNLRDIIHQNLPEGATSYKILGMKTQKCIYGLGVKNVKSFTKPDSEVKKVLSLDQMTSGQIGLFGNLNNLQSLDVLNEFSNSFSVIKDETSEEDRKILLMVSKEKDSLGRIVITRYGIFFRAYTAEEEEEFLAKQDAEEAKALGLNIETDSLLLAADF